MRVIEHLHNITSPSVSVEIIPPTRGRNIENIHAAIDSIKHLNPPFIDVTSHAAEVVWEEMPDGTFRRKIKRKSPGTFGLCAMIKYKYNIEPVPHLLCGGFTREETEDALIELNYLGIENVLALRGDKSRNKPVREDRTENRHALDLVSQITNMNEARYLDDLIDAAKTNFCIGVAFYPEKHFEAPNLNMDMRFLKQKQDAGAHYAVSQMFFDTPRYLAFVEKAKGNGISMPLVPGMKIITGKDQLSRLASIFHIDFPDELIDRMMAAKTRAEEIEVGVEWAYRQSLDLLEAGHLNLHFYIMQNTNPFLNLMDRLKKHL